MAALFLTTALYAAAALAVPTPELAARAARGSSHPPIRVAKPGPSPDTNTTSATDYSSNWSGGVLVSSGITEVEARWTVPAVSMPNGGDPNTQYGAFAWVGIDGDTCGSAILQTGLSMTIQNGQVSYGAWYEWFPAGAAFWDSSSISFNQGDTVFAKVVATSTSSGTAYVQNLSNGQSVSYSFSGQSAQLCQTNAEWILEDYSVGGGLEPFIDYGSISFEGAQATINGNIVGSGGSTPFDIVANNQVVSSGQINGNNEVVCTYE